ncbi:MAG: hypothetical protein ABW123_22430 [Cystobacter sp.]
MHNLSTSTFKRILAINWKGSYNTTPSRLALMSEHLRRTAWWAEASKATLWPFFDIAYAINQDVRASPALVSQLEAHLTSKMQLPSSRVAMSCVRALHFAALLDKGTPLPKLPDSVQQPFEPLLLMFERGGGFRVDGAGLIDIDSIGLQKGTLQSRRTEAPMVSMEPTQLDALDASRKF